MIGETKGYRMYKSWMWKQRSFREQFQGDEGNGSAGGSGAEQQQDDQQQAEGETSGAEQQDDQEDQGQGAAEDDEVVITIGDEAPPAANDDGLDGRPAPQWLKDMRKRDREQARRIRELETEKAQREAAAAPKVEEVGPEPDISDEGIDYDAAVFKEKWKAWSDRKAKAEATAAADRQQQEAAAAEWNQQLSAYRTAAASLKVDGFEDAEAAVTATLNPTQVGILVQGPNAQAAAQLVAALGRSPAELKKLAAITNPVKYAFAVAELVGKLKVQPRKQPPPAERQVRSSAGGATSVDNTLKKLRDEADKSGDRSKVAAYLRKQEQAA